MSTSEDSTGVTARILEMLSGAGIDYRHLQHQETPTSEESARVRGEPIEIGGKALVFKAGERFFLFVVSAARRVDSKRLRKVVGARSIRFASREELRERTGLVPGSVPPFGRPILDLDLVVDESVLANERIAFNAGSLTESVIMSTSDWKHLARPETIVDVSLPA